MDVSFKELALTNMLWLANSLWLLASAFLIRLICIIFPRFSRGKTKTLRFESEETNPIDSLGVSNAKTSKYEFLGGNSFCGYIQDPQITSFQVQELFLNSDSQNPKTEDSVKGFASTDDQVEINESSLNDELEEIDSEENQLMFSFDQVNQEPKNDFWHTNGEFIAGFDGFYDNQSVIEELLAPDTPIIIDKKTIDPYEDDDISGSDSTDSADDDLQASVINHIKAEEEEEDEEEEMENDVILEHQSYVQKMKKEMKHLRITGLPTILEDYESPRMDVDLKPLKLDEKMGYKDRLDEIQRFYKTYSDKMKRLDILCHQTMYAIGFLQLKNPDQVAANKKQSSVPSIKSLIAHNLLPNKFRRHGSDPLQKLIRDLQKDLELVYVAQICLSWEILKWQHAKAEELQHLDNLELRQYSAVGGEFRQFQVVVQRFTEDEQFQGPRVENYVKTRSINCNLLQVPPIKEDSKVAEERHAVVSIVRLTDIIEESMHSFWEFIRADKKESGNVGSRDPLDAELLSDIRTNLAKKDRRIKDLVRNGNCIVKKFQKHPDCRLSHELVVALVEMKLVARVIGMSGLTADQMEWCHKKLGKISVVGRKVHIESSFSVFPC